MNFFDSFFKKDNDQDMKFSLEIGPQTDVETVPPVSDIYITMLPGGDYRETAQKAIDAMRAKGAAMAGSEIVGGAMGTVLRELD